MNSFPSRFSFYICTKTKTMLELSIEISFFKCIYLLTLLHGSNRCNAQYMRHIAATNVQSPNSDQPFKFRLNNYETDLCMYSHIDARVWICKHNAVLSSTCTVCDNQSPSMIQITHTKVHLSVPLYLFVSLHFYLLTLLFTPDPLSLFRSRFDAGVGGVARRQISSFLSRSKAQTLTLWV